MVSFANFAERIKELRTETGLTQEQLAEKAGATRMTVIRWERGDNIPTEDNLLFLARLFKVSMYYLLGYTDDREMIASEGYEEAEARGEKADEERLLNRYRLLTPEMKKMIHAVVNNAILIERDRKA